MRNKPSISKSVLAIVSGVLLLSLGAVVGGIEIYKATYLTESIGAVAKEESASAEKSLFNLLYEVIGYGQTAFPDSSCAAFLASEDKEGYLKAIYADSGLNGDLYYDVSVYGDGRFYSLRGNEPYIVSSPYIERLEANPSSFFLLERAPYEGGFALVTGIHRSGLSIFYLLKEATLAPFLRSSFEQSFTLFYGPDALLVSGVDAPEASLHSPFDSSEYLLVETSSDSLSRFAPSSRFCTYVSRSAAFGTINLVEIVVGCLLALAFLSSGTVAYFRSRKVSRPLSALSERMEKERFEGPGERLPYPKSLNHEIEVLERSYDEMVARIYTLMAAQSRDAEEKRKLELDSLLQQINPHFLYNSLDAIAWMGKLSNNKDVERAVVALAGFYRLSLSKGRSHVSVKDEVAISSYYLDVQSVSFPEAFAHEEAVDEEAASFFTLKLIVQPFVENAVKHAFEGREGGHICVRAFLDGDKVAFIVEDDGVGFDPKSLGKGPSGEGRGGYGIYNVKERLRLEYGSEANVVIDSEIGRGTRVKITIPQRKISGD